MKSIIELYKYCKQNNKSIIIKQVHDEKNHCNVPMVCGFMKEVQFDKLDALEDELDIFIDHAIVSVGLGKIRSSSSY